MNAFDMITKLDGMPRIAGILMLAIALLWAIAMLAALLPSKRASKGFRRTEIAVILLSICLTGAMTFVRQALATPEPEPATTAAPSGGGGTGTCASVRPGMKAAEVATLLGTPAIDQSAEDARGPGARVLVFEDSRCVVHLLNGAVDFVE